MILQRYGVGLDSLRLNAGVVDYEENGMKEPCLRKSVISKDEGASMYRQCSEYDLQWEWCSSAWCGLLSLCGILCLLLKYGLSLT